MRPLLALVSLDASGLGGRGASSSCCARLRRVIDGIAGGGQRGGAVELVGSARPPASRCEQLELFAMTARRGNGETCLASSQLGEDAGALRPEAHTKTKKGRAIAVGDFEVRGGGEGRGGLDLLGEKVEVKERLATLSTLGVLFPSQGSSLEEHEEAAERTSGARERSISSTYPILDLSVLLRISRRKLEVRRHLAASSSSLPQVDEGEAWDELLESL
eukprot:764423-Hanusia_phi.AAC.1